MAVEVTWQEPGAPILVVPARLTLAAFAPRFAQLLAQAGPSRHAWVVLRRTDDAFPGPLYYAFHAHEVEDRLAASGGDASQSLEGLFNLRETQRSTTVRGRRPGAVEPEALAYGHSPATTRVVHFDLEGNVATIGEWGAPAAPAPTAPPAPSAPAPPPPPPRAAARAPAMRSGRRSMAPPPPRALDDLERADGDADADDGVEMIDEASDDVESADEAFGGTEMANGDGGGSHDEDTFLDELVDLGGTMGGSGARSGARAGALPGAAPPRGAAPSPDTIPIVLSAETPSELAVGTQELVDFRIEHAEGATPLASAIRDVTAGAVEPIRVVLSVSNGCVVVEGQRWIEVKPPAQGRASVGEFKVRAVAAGEVVLALSFRQGGSELGAIRLPMAVVAAAADEAAHPTSGLMAPAPVPRARAQATAAPRDPADDDVLTMLIELRADADGTRYEFQLVSEPLGLHYVTLRSRPLMDRTGSLTQDQLAYVAWIYERATQQVLNLDDVKRFQRELRTLGMTLCDELFSPEVSRKLWPLRDRIKSIQVTSWEPYIPWELVRLKDPDSSDVDERYFAEYGLIRTLRGEAPPRSLPMRSWSYLAATYPNGTEKPVNTRVAFLERDLPAHGIAPTAIAPGYDAFWAAIEAGSFDVLHLACHGQAAHDRIETAALLIGDEIGSDGKPQPIEVDAVSVRQDAKLHARHPLVFLQACESGRQGVGLTAWGGWPTAFIEAGAGAFVGASWPVREKPAERFASAFYNAMFDGQTLAEAATAARLATKDMGDASWLAFKVFGHPQARRTP